MPHAVGIDLGTTRSVIAYVAPDGRPLAIRNAEGDISTPSVVFFEPQSVIVGKEAIKAGKFEPDAVAQFVKRDVGRAVYSRSIRGERLPPEVLQALILRKLRADAERAIGEVRRVVVTVPAFFNEPRRKSTQDAGRLAGLEVADIINEPTAAAIAFGVQNGFLSDSGEARQRERILVYDLGGGTFDATLMDITGRNFHAIATVGDVQLGGIDWDQRIVDYVAEQFVRQYGFDPRRDPVAAQTLLLEAEDAKHSLSVREEVTIHFQYDTARVRVPLTRDQFETMTADLLERTRFTVTNMLRETGLKWDEITRVLLVGGSTRMPMVPAMLERESRRPPDRSLSPDEAVAHGAALYASLLQAGDGTARPKMIVRNVSSHDLGVLGFEGSTRRRRRKVMIGRNTPLPATGRSTFLTQVANQPNVKVDVVEGGDASGQGATPIGKCVIDDLPPGLPTRSKIEVLFTYGANGRLTVKARLPDVNREATLTIERASGLSEPLLKTWEDRLKSGQLLGHAAPVAPSGRPGPAYVAPRAEGTFRLEAAEEDSDSTEIEIVVDELPPRAKVDRSPLRPSPGSHGGTTPARSVPAPPRPRDSDGPVVDVVSSPFDTLPEASDSRVLEVNEFLDENRPPP